MAGKTKQAPPVRYVREGKPDRLVYTVGQKVQAEYDGFVPAKPAGAKAAEKLPPSGSQPS